MVILEKNKNDTSSIIDLLRALAAQAVCVGHAIMFFRSDLMPSSLPLMQNVGVLVFFVLSGFLIAYTLQRKAADPDYGFFRYALERFARIYSGLVPSLAFVMLCDAIIGQRDSFLSLLANLLMNEGYRGIFPNALPREPFGSAHQLWTLAIEWHIYLSVGAAFFLFLRRGRMAILVLILLFYGQTSSHYLWGAYQADGVGRGLFSLWLGGAATYLLISRLHIGREAALLLALAAFSILLVQTHRGEEYSFLVYALLLVAFVGLVSWSQRTNGISKVASERIRFFADYSLTLYLTHHSLMVLMKAFQPEAGAMGLVVAVIASNLAAICLAEIGEKQHRRILAILLAR
ncbi:acyltransferase family protein [Bradyrhizobium diversitatis]|uniref:Acyltransferase n=1 Tax=Bradyrhizobium diversitatis TaxID=2755406 RepID=A0ABS0P1M4_9BRAD|nr:acyltransferase [Bradyrhizobium diversitatis]MBH5387015.1 acyltransferase [Bradyrhizobium diversitatis]